MKTACSAVSGCPARSSSVSAIISNAAEATPGCQTQRRAPRKTSGNKAHDPPTAHRTKKAIEVEYMNPTEAISADEGRQPISRAKRKAPRPARKKVMAAE